MTATASGVPGQADGDVRRKRLGVGLGGRFPSQVTVRMLNHGPPGEVRTAESVTVTG